MLTKYFQFVKTKWFIALSCLVLGAVVILGIRFVTYKPVTVHYHANFALYLNGQHEMFQGAQYYAETEMCTESAAMTPIGRAHMHDNVNNVVHVEDHAVTWGQFFTNLGWTLGPNFIQAPDNTMYVENGNQKLNVILNNQDYTDLGNMANFEIKDQDKLLISYGDEAGPSLMQEFNAIPSTAHKYDMSKDTGSCGSHGSTSMHDRLTHMF
jgi:hypothetical protein